MILRDWLNCTSEAERVALASAAETTVSYLWQIAGSHRAGSAKLTLRLASASTKVTPDRVMRASELRPDIFGDQSAA